MLTVNRAITITRIIDSPDTQHRKTKNIMSHICMETPHRDKTKKLKKQKQELGELYAENIHWLEIRRGVAVK